MKEYKYASRWQVDKVLESLPKQEQEKFINSVIRTLKRKKAYNKDVLLLHEHWSFFGPIAFVSGLSSVACAVLAKYLNEDIWMQIALGSGILAVLNTGVFSIGGLISDDDVIIKRHIYDEKLEKQIEYLKVRKEKNNGTYNNGYYR